MPSSQVERPGATGPEPKLRLIKTDDGDVIVLIVQKEVVIGDRERELEAEVQFCTFQGGGTSPKTLRALWALMKAMEEDNTDYPLA